MKVVGLITEYNPFHNGHLYHIEKAKEVTGADHVLVVMSGDFVQRGAPALMPKHMRAEMALRAGASVVLELPVCFACGSAEYFASAAVSLLNKLNCVDAICFGSECEDREFLEKAAQITAEEPAEYRQCLLHALKKGLSFPLARQEALKSVLKAEHHTDSLKYPNTILGIEYIKALITQKSSMDFHIIKRIGSGYHDNTLKESLSSASAIRNLFTPAESMGFSEKEALCGSISLSEILDALKVQVPAFCITSLKNEYHRRYPLCADDFSLLFKYRLLSEQPDTLTNYLDVTPELANRISKHISDFFTFSQFCRLLKTKDMTYTRISRCLIHILLNITAQSTAVFKDEGYCLYARILGLRKDKQDLLSCMKRNSGIPLVTKLTRIEHVTQTGRIMLAQDIAASNLYESVITDKFKTPFLSDYQHQIVRIGDSY
ncbi:MAG: nucleotidyltransferase [Dorea sp.]|nr:nucleotidyltransferase [Dorea sp.]